MERRRDRASVRRQPAQGRLKRASRGRQGRTTRRPPQRSQRQRRRHDEQQRTDRSGTVIAGAHKGKHLERKRAAAEPPIAGVALALWKKQGADFVITGKTTTTDSQGFYKFGTDLNLTPGVYQVRESQPSGFLSVGAIPGTVSGTATGTTVSGNIDILTEINIPLGNQHGEHFDFAEFQPSSIRGHVHLADKYGNCEEEGGVSTPLAGVRLILKDAAGKTVGTTQTNAAGEDEFTNLPRGTYQVVE